MKYVHPQFRKRVYSRPPHGGRGLKYNVHHLGMISTESPPARGAWIEIFTLIIIRLYVLSPPARGAWIEMYFQVITKLVTLCRPPHGGRGLK